MGSSTEVCIFDERLKSKLKRKEILLNKQVKRQKTKKN
jgi:hypothetical protein